MKNKIKIFLGFVLGFLAVGISQTNALTLFGDPISLEYTGNRQGYTLIDNGGDYGYCITTTYGVDGGVKTNSNLCDDGYYTRYDFDRSDAYPFYFKKESFWSSLHYNVYHNKSNLFTVLAIENEDGIKSYKKVVLKGRGSSMVKLTSLRGSYTYEYATVADAGLVLGTHDGLGPRLSYVVNNVYALDGFFIVVNRDKGYLVDTHSHVIYEYPEPFYQQDSSINLFQKIYNIVPTKVYGIEFNEVISDNKICRGGPKNCSYFHIVSESKGTKETLQNVQIELRRSLKIYNEELAKYYLQTDPKDLSFGDGGNISNNTGNKTPSGAEEKKSCIDYYTKIKAMTAHSDGCFGDGSNEERTMYRTNVIEDDYANYNAWDKARYWRCWQFANYREETKKVLGGKFDTFISEWKSFYMGLSANDVDVNAMCSHISLSNQEKLQEVKDNQSILDKLWHKIGFLNNSSGEPIGVDGSGNALYQEDFQNELRALQPYYWECHGYDKYGLTKLTNQTETERKNACKRYDKYKNKLISKWHGVELEYTNDPTVEGQVKMQEERLGKGNGMLESVGSGVSNTLSEGGEVLLKAIKDPFYSGYNAIIPLKCSSSPHIEFMNLFLYGLFVIFVFIIFKML